jgi:RimJ/RimL family protein N-acetyltransferase
VIVIGPGVVEWVAKKTNEFGNFGAAVGIGLKKNGEIIAGVVFNDYNGVNIQMHVASDGSKRWLTREFLWTVFDYPFNQAKVNRITTLVGEGNKEALKFNEHIGFERETTLRGAHPTGDFIVYVMWKRNCAWISQEFKKHYAKAA